MRIKQCKRLEHAIYIDFFISNVIIGLCQYDNEKKYKTLQNFQKLKISKITEMQEAIGLLKALQKPRRKGKFPALQERKRAVGFVQTVNKPFAKT